MNKNHALVLAAAAALAAGCKSPQARTLASPFQAPAKVAVLPVANQSVDVGAPELMRRLMQDALASKGYSLLPPAQVDQGLDAMSIHEAGQLASTTPQEVGRKLGVDGLLYGEVTTFAFQNLGYYQNWKAGAVFKLVEASTGRVLWEDEESASKKAVHLSQEEAKEAFAAGLAQHVAQKTIGDTKVGRALGINAPLEEQARQVVARLMRTLPNR